MRSFALLIACLPSMAAAADRTVAVGTFERVRVEGPFDVRLAMGSPGARIVGDRQAIDRIEVRLDGATLVVRMGGDGWGEQPRKVTAAPPQIVLSSPALSTASVVGGARLAIDRMKAQRIDLTVSGTGSIAVTRLDTDQLNATVIGAGGMTLAGRAARARLLTNGAGTTDASGLVADDLTIRVDGAGETTAQARYTAQVTNSGLGRVKVRGKPKCLVKAAGGGPVTCGN